MIFAFAGRGSAVKARLQSKLMDLRLGCVGSMHGKGNVQRIRIGLTGLAFVFLLVLLGAAVSKLSRDGQVVPNAASSAQNSQPSDPLSDLGVAPGASAEAGNGSAATNKTR